MSTSPPWSAVGRDWSIAWSPTSPYLTGSAAVVAEIEAVLGRAETIRMAPTSTAVPATTSNSVAVFDLLDRPFTASASAPRFESVKGRIY